VLDAYGNYMDAYGEMVISKGNTKEHEEMLFYYHNLHHDYYKKPPWI
jgi:hypothetical protein